MNKKAVLLFGLMLLAFSCGTDDVEDESSKVSVEEGRKLQITNLYDNQIIAIQKRHLEVLDVLVVKSEGFSSTPSASSLSVLQDAWKDAFLHWQSLEIYNLGAIQSSFIHTRIHQWPVNETSIETNINGEEAISNDYISTTAANTKGYSAIEYLLFNGMDEEVLSAFSTNNNSQRRRQYLIALVQNLREQSNLLQAFWKDLESVFKTNLETGVDGSQNQVVNAMIAGLEKIKGTKIEKAINAASNKVEKLEAYRSELSKEAIKINLTTIYDSYLGDFQGADGFGLSEYTLQVLERSDIDTVIKNAFSEAFSNLDAISGSLETSLGTDVAKIEDFRLKIQNIISIFKTDFSSSANIIVTFNDNDGD